MSKIAILCDSSCDIPQELADKYGIDILNFHILLDGVDYVERESFSATEFYDMMRKADGVPTTAAITPIEFCAKYCDYVDAGYTDVIYISINRGASSTHDNAIMGQNLLREERPEHTLKVHVIDSHTYSMCFGWYVCELARKIRNGAEVRHVGEEFLDRIARVEIVLGPYSLRQMKKSGRISAAAAFAGELLGLRPIISLIDGQTKVETKVRGDDKVIPAMLAQCSAKIDQNDLFEYMVGYTDLAQVNDLVKLCRKQFGCEPVCVFKLGGVVSANTGPDTLAIAYLGKKRA
ncbi:MAG: DegV family protein [Faecalibacterium sp.]